MRSFPILGMVFTFVGYFILYTVLIVVINMFVIYPSRITWEDTICPRTYTSDSPSQIDTWVCENLIKVPQ